MTRALERARSHAFWALDALKGAPVRSNLRDIEAILEAPTAQASAARRQELLDACLTHAVGTTPFYRDFAGYSTLADFPVIDKNALRDAASAHMSSADAGKRLYPSTTSGSTGTPFTVFQDAAKRARHRADNIYFCRLAGYEMGTRVYSLKVWNRELRKSSLANLAANTVAWDIGDLSDVRFASLLTALSNDCSTKALFAYSSTLEALCGYLPRLPPGPLDVRLTTIMANSESLPGACREKLERAFVCPVVSPYSDRECGFIAQQCHDQSGDYHVNWASFYVELLALNGDERVGPGELGRIVVTDLFNFAMPIIRYDTGDTGVMAESAACGWPLPALARVEGRRVDFLYDTQGRPTSPHVVSNSMWKYAEVRQYQLIQESAGEYRMKLNVGSAFGRESELLGDLRSRLGEGASIAIEYVDEIPPLASGKRRAVVNNCQRAARVDPVANAVDVEHVRRAGR